MLKKCTVAFVVEPKILIANTGGHDSMSVHQNMTQIYIKWKDVLKLKE